jgi:U4/U6.U5 tri-snRNP-associated protein 2
MSSDTGINSKKRKVKDCPYLDTINREFLDFDMEPACCITLESGPHIYCCLICGKFYRGRGSQTPAYLHAVDEGHYCFVHLQEGTFHCLPDDYEIVDSSLDDISEALHPHFTKQDIDKLDDNTQLARDWFGRQYLPGFIGLNNLNRTDDINAMIQALAHVKPLRNYFLQQSHRDLYIPSRKKNKPPQRISNIVLAFGELVRKLWSRQRLKHSVDPQRLVQEISAVSQKRFGSGRRAEMGELLAWFLHQLHVGLGGSAKKSSIVHDIFQGQVQVTTKSRRKIMDNSFKQNEDDRLGSDDEEEEMKDSEEQSEPQFVIEEKTSDTSFLQLTLEIPEKPLFKDDEGGLVIPQEPLVNVLRKFDGMTFSDALNGSMRRYKLQKLPPYLILHLLRFTSNRYTREKNHTIVTFPVKNFDLSTYVHDDSKRQTEPPPSEAEIREMSVQQLKTVLKRYNQDKLAENIVEKQELIRIVSEICTKSLSDMLADKYDLVANITHASNDTNKQGDPLQEGSYKCHVQHYGSRQWYEMQDLHFQEIMPQLIGLSESYVLIFERKGVKMS